MNTKSSAIRKPELLMPASNLEVLKTAVRYGADAVYIGGDAYGLRAGARNFSPEEMREGIACAHSHGVRVHVTVNILAHHGDLDGIGTYLHELGRMKPDALIISDPGVFDMAKEICPEIERHISTQANNTNERTFAFWHRQGAKRAVCARELSLTEIRALRDTIPADMEIEAFVHGAMCISYSGRCLMSSFLTGRDANQGACTHPCRWQYSVVEETRPGEVMPVYENERGTFIFHSKDLCMIEHIDDLIAAGIDSFKVEGRMKNALYVATVCRAYRDAIDRFLDDPESYRGRTDWYKEQVSSCTHRNFCTGFYYGRPESEGQVYTDAPYHRDRIYLGIAGEAEGCLFSLIQKNKFCVGDEIEIMGFDGDDRICRVLSITDEEGRAQESAPHAGQRLRVEVTGPVHPGEVLRSL